MMVRSRVVCGHSNGAYAREFACAGGALVPVSGVDFRTLCDMQALPGFTDRERALAWDELARRIAAGDEKSAALVRCIAETLSEIRSEKATAWNRLLLGETGNGCR